MNWNLDRRQSVCSLTTISIAVYWLQNPTSKNIACLWLMHPLIDQAISKAWTKAMKQTR